MTLPAVTAGADAITQRDPRELTTSESKELLKKIRGLGERAPHLVLTGGDPLKRPDFFDLLEYGASLGLRMSVAPSGTIALTRDVLKRFKGDRCGEYIAESRRFNRREA